MKKLLKILLVIMCLGFGPDAFAATALKELTPIKIAQWGKEKILLYLPLYVAMEEGFFAKNGLDVNLIYTGNDDQTFATVITGDADFGVSDPVFTAIAAEKGLKAKTVATIITNLGLTGYTNKPNVPEIKKADDLAGLRISSFPEPSTTYTLLSEMKRSNSKLKDMQIVPGIIGTQLAMLNADKVDIAIDFEPAVSQAESKGYRVVFPMTKFMDQQVVTGFITTQENIDKHADTVQKAVTSLQQAMTAMNSDPQVGYRTALKLFPQLGEDVIRRAIKRMLGNKMFPQSVKVKDSDWQRSLKTRLDSGELKRPQPTSMAVDNRFAEKAQQIK